MRVGCSVCVGTGLATPKQTYVNAPNIKGRSSTFKVNLDSIKTELDKMLLDKSIDGNMLELGGFKTWKVEQQVNVETLVTVEVGYSNHNTEVGDSMVDIARAIARPQTYVTKYFKTLGK